MNKWYVFINGRKVCNCVDFNKAREMQVLYREMYPSDDVTIGTCIYVNRKDNV